MRYKVCGDESTTEYFMGQIYSTVYPSLINKENFNVNSFLASGNVFHLLITFANSLNPDQDRQNISPNLDPNCLVIDIYCNIR